VIIKLAGRELVISTPNPLTRWQAEGLVRNEPETIRWISGFSRSSVFVDIGANMGMFSLLAAVLRNSRVFAFEPAAQNYGLFNRNIARNGLDRNITAFCVALSNRAGFDRLHLSSMEFGGSGNSFDGRESLTPSATSFNQGSFSTTLDQLVADGAIPVPDYIKIDVDGLEPKILEGADATLGNLRLKSILIEIDPNVKGHESIAPLMARKGFFFDSEQVLSSSRTTAPKLGKANYIFFRRSC
jgi:FkbM family methyltransferase